MRCVAGAVAACLATFFLCGPCFAAASATRPIVIYYADETTPETANSANYRALLALLSRSRSALAAHIQASLLIDRREFPASVAADAQALLAAAKRNDFDLAVFTNQLALKARFLLFREGSAGFEARPLAALPAAPNAVLAGSPLSRLDYFEAALDAVGANYPAGSLNAVLITHSHGDEAMALTPRVFADLSYAGADDVLRRLDREPRTGDARPQWARDQGVKKRDYWLAIARAGRRYGIHFSFVFLDSCRSGVFTFGQAAAVPPSVDLVGDTGHADIGLSDIDYRSVLGASSVGRPVAAALADQLQRRGLRVDSRPGIWAQATGATVGRVYPALFFLPLAIWLIWAASDVIRGRPDRAARNRRLT